MVTLLLACAPRLTNVQGSAYTLELEVSRNGDYEIRRSGSMTGTELEAKGGRAEVELPEDGDQFTFSVGYDKRGLLLSHAGQGPDMWRIEHPAYERAVACRRALEFTPDEQEPELDGCEGVDAWADATGLARAYLVARSEHELVADELYDAHRELSRLDNEALSGGVELTSHLAWLSASPAFTGDDVDECIEPEFPRPPRPWDAYDGDEAEAFGTTTCLAARAGVHTCSALADEAAERHLEDPDLIQFLAGEGCEAAMLALTDQTYDLGDVVEALLEPAARDAVENAGDSLLSFALAIVGGSFLVYNELNAFSECESAVSRRSQDSYDAWQDALNAGKTEEEECDRRTDRVDELEIRLAELRTQVPAARSDVTLLSVDEEAAERAQAEAWAVFRGRLDDGPQPTDVVTLSGRAVGVGSVPRTSSRDPLTLRHVRYQRVFGSPEAERQWNGGAVALGYGGSPTLGGYYAAFGRHLHPVRFGGDVLWDRGVGPARVGTYSDWFWTAPYNRLAPVTGISLSYWRDLDGFSIDGRAGLYATRRGGVLELGVLGVASYLPATGDFMPQVAVSVSAGGVN